MEKKAGALAARQVPEPVNVNETRAAEITDAPPLSVNHVALLRLVDPDLARHRARRRRASGAPLGPGSEAAARTTSCPWRRATARPWWASCGVEPAVAVLGAVPAEGVPGALTRPAR